MESSSLLLDRLIEQPTQNDGGHCGPLLASRRAVEAVQNRSKSSGHWSKSSSMIMQCLMKIIAVVIMLALL